MRLYAIHAPGGAATEDIRAAKTGFSFWALVFGPLWLLARGLWLALAGYALIAAVVAVLAHEAALRPVAVVALFALGNLYLSIEGRALAIASWVRAGWPLVDVVHARSALEAERTCLERTLAAPSFRRGPASAGSDVIGMFPEPGR